MPLDSSFAYMLVCIANITRHSVTVTVINSGEARGHVMPVLIKHPVKVLINSKHGCVLVASVTTAS